MPLRDTTMVRHLGRLMFISLGRPVVEGGSLSIQFTRVHERQCSDGVDGVMATVLSLRSISVAARADQSWRGRVPTRPTYGWFLSGRMVTGVQLSG
jgi:hypothetical protein